MKKITLALLIPVSMMAFSSCGGDHGARNLGDTAKNSYKVPRDTSKADSVGVDTATIDHSGSGGTTIPKPDTPKKK